MLRCWRCRGFHMHGLNRMARNTNRHQNLIVMFDGDVVKILDPCFFKRQMAVTNIKKVKILDLCFNKNTADDNDDRKERLSSCVRG